MWYVAADGSSWLIGVLVHQLVCIWVDLFFLWTVCDL